MTEDTKRIIRDALQHRERSYRGFANCDRIDAVHCQRSDNPIIRSRAENLEQWANEGDAKADMVLRALEEFNRENSVIYKPSGDMQTPDLHQTTP